MRLKRHAAVDVEGPSGHGTTIGAAQIPHDVSHLCRSTKPGGRNCAEEPLHGRSAEHLCVDEPRGNNVDGDAARLQFNTATWAGTGNGPEGVRIANITSYVTKNSDIINFNRYTGVVVK